MKFTKNIGFDIQNGILKNKDLFLCPIFIAIITFVNFRNQVKQLEVLHMLNPNSASFADYWFFLYGGMKEYIPSPGNPFLFPVVWILLFVTPAFLVLNYPVRNMQDIGTQILVYGKSRSSWWMSKCFWNFICTILFHLIIG